LPPEIVGAAVAHAVDNPRAAALERDENIGGLDVAVYDSFGVSNVEASAISMARESMPSVSMGRPAMRCFRVTRSRNSMAMNALPSCSPMS
jgi:hypothetical protein